jgi:hypothetical protein
MSPITLSPEALTQYRRHIEKGGRRVDDSNREADRELARAGIMDPVSGDATGPEPHYLYPPSDGQDTYGVLWRRDRENSPHSSAEPSWVVKLHFARPVRSTLDSAPPDAAIDPETGVFRWTPPAGPFQQRVVVVANGGDDLNRRAQRVISLARIKPGEAVTIVPEPAATTSTPAAVVIEIPGPVPPAPSHNPS